jgi:hypothetical protein
MENKNVNPKKAAITRQWELLNVLAQDKKTLKRINQLICE